MSYSDEELKHFQTIFPDMAGSSLFMTGNPKHPGSFQWESLTDAQARQLIEGALDEFVDMDVIASIRRTEQEQLAEIAERISNG